MARYLMVEGTLARGPVVLTGREARHARVLRLGAGDRVQLCDGRGQLYTARVVTVTRDRVEAEVLEPAPAQVMPAVSLVLGQALPKAAKMDLVIEKATELGADRIIPFTSVRTIPQPRASTRLLRWHRLAEAASKQCGRPVVPEVTDVVPFDEFLRMTEPLPVKLLLWEGEAERSLRTLLREGGRPGGVALAVGPEGGFAPEEVERARARGFVPVSLGPRILRTETAGLAALAIVQYELSEFA